MSHQKIKVNEQTNCSPNEKLVVEEPMLKVVLDEIQIKYSTCLEKCRTRGKYFQRYICHRGGEPRRFSKCIRRCKSSKKCGWTFRVDIKRSMKNINQLFISLYSKHKGHDPRSPHEVYHNFESASKCN